MDGLEEESMDGGAGGLDSDFEVDGDKRKNTRKNAKKPKKAGTTAIDEWKDVYNVDDEDDPSDQPKKQRAQKQAKAPKQPRKPKEVHMSNPNMVKTANRLIGEVENQDLYNSDDEQQNQHDPLNFAGNLELDLN